MRVEKLKKKKIICPQCKKEVSGMESYWGICLDCITPEMRQEAEREDFEENNSKCPCCHEYIPNNCLDDNGECFDCVWRGEYEG